MKTEWDYTHLADAYIKRPPYAEEAIDTICSVAEMGEGAWACDIGAGVGHMTIPLAERGFSIDAVEPNDAMRSRGMARTGAYPAVAWHEGVGEDTGMPASRYDLTTFGSSFSVCDRMRALAEAHRILKPGKWFCCLWNHRDLTDPTQARVESIIKSFIPDYDYGTRREDQAPLITRSGLFTAVTYFESPVLHTEQKTDVVTAWRSHATLKRQAKGNFERIVESIAEYLDSLPGSGLTVPYMTRGWIAQRQ